MKIGIIGSGQIGGTLTRRLTQLAQASKTRAPKWQGTVRHSQLNSKRGVKLSSTQDQRIR
jgi:predicted dinucleotide-binding enzyme